MKVGYRSGLLLPSGAPPFYCRGKKSVLLKESRGYLPWHSIGVAAHIDGTTRSNSNNRGD